jgi:HSP20 family molecular chaperone IbpA
VEPSRSSFKDSKVIVSLLLASGFHVEGNRVPHTCQTTFLTKIAKQLIEIRDFYQASNSTLTPDRLNIMPLCQYNNRIAYADPFLRPVFTVVDPVHLVGRKRWDEHRSGSSCSNCPASPSAFLHASEISESDAKYEITTDVPGVKLADLSVTVDQSGPHPVLQITGTRRRAAQRAHSAAASHQNEETKNDGEPESSLAKFEKRFLIKDATADFENMTASLSHGVLVVSVPKVAKATKSNIVVTITEERTADSAEDLGFVDVANDTTTVETVDEEKEKVRSADA